MKGIDRKGVDRRVLLAGIGGVMAGTMLTGRAKAGNLEPPGAPGPTGKTTDQLADRASRTAQGCANPCTPVESLPGSQTSTYEITAPGSYTLTRNLIGEDGKNGIAILSPDVDLDLCGFHLLGPSGSGGLVTGAGIVCNSENFTVYDGTIRGWLRGLDLSLASRFIVWDVASIGAVATGVSLGDNGECYDVDVHNCGGTGIECHGHGTLVHECGAWTCSVGFGCVTPGASGNLILSNCATGCATPFSLAGGGAFGPIAQVQGVGDISPVLEARHPLCNLAF